MTQTPQPDDLVTIQQVMKVLGVSKRTVWRMVERGELVKGPDPKPGYPATVTKRSLVEGMERRDAGTGDEAQPQPTTSTEAALVREALDAREELGRARAQVAQLERETGRADRAETEAQELREEISQLREERAQLGEMSRWRFGKWRKAQRRGAAEAE